MNNRCILLVEDNPDDADLTLRAFRRHNISNEVIVVTDGVEALDFLMSTGKYSGAARRILPAVVLLDLKLPKLDGLQVLRRIRADPTVCLIPVVVLTSSQEEQDIVESYKLGANSYVRKPVDFTEFMEAARILGLYWLMLNEPRCGVCKP